MKISIITATYNSAATVRDTLESIAQQTYTNIEHIIVDGLSKDNTLAIVNEYPHVAKVVSEKDKGIYDAMNKGVALATGDIVAILNSDDFYYNNEVIEQVMNCFAQHQTDAVYGDLVYVNAENTDKITRNWKAGSYSRKQFLYGWMPPHPSFFVHKNMYEKYGNFNLSLRSAADYEFMLRLLYKHQASVAYLPTTIVKMRVGGLSNASLANRLAANKEDRKAWQLNDLEPYPFTTWLKPLRKITQFL
jgi:glycosyltransferase involved in cell wall biosynthesis